MREYLFELRKKVGLSQREVSEKMGQRYGGIEKGRCWAEITVERAALLASALDTTPEFIMENEKSEGGYVGKHDYLLTGDTINSIRAGASSKQEAYALPLTKEEQEFAESYHWYAKKIIDILRYQDFSYAREKGWLSYEDFEDVGMLYYLQSVKYIFAIKREKADYFEEISVKDYWYRAVISKRIKHGLSKEIRKVKAVSRRSNTTAFALDKEKYKDGEDDFYDFIFAQDIPVSIQAESGWFLHNLYKYLSPEQIEVCGYLISGYSPADLVRNKISTLIEIGKIKFYLIQMQKYGRVLWTADEYISGEKGVSFNFYLNKWEVGKYYKKKVYALGAYTDLVTAIDVSRLAEYHCVQDDFNLWYKNHLQPNVYSELAFTYPMDLADDIDLLNSDFNSIKINMNTRHTMEKATLDKPVGCQRMRPGSSSWMASVGKKSLGAFKSLEEAIDARNLAIDHIRLGDFEQWFAKYKEEKKKSQFPPLHSYYHKEKNAYHVEHVFNRKRTVFGYYNSEEAAAAIVELGNTHIKKGDFFEWAAAFNAERKSKENKPAGKPKKTRLKQKVTDLVEVKDISIEPSAADAAVLSVIKGIRGQWQVLCGSELLAAYNRETLALQVKQLAEMAIADGTFEIFKANFAKG